MIKYIVLLWTTILWSQTTTHKVILNWEDLLNPPSSTTYNVYRSNGLCSGTPTFNMLASSLTNKQYTDDTVTPGNYCYVVTATVSGVQSAYSNAALAPVPAFVPTKLVASPQ